MKPFRDELPKAVIAYLSEEDHAALKACSERIGIPMYEVASDAIANYLNVIEAAEVRALEAMAAQVVALKLAPPSILVGT